MNRMSNSEWAITILSDVEKFLTVNGMQDSAAVVLEAARTLRRQTIADSSKLSFKPEIRELYSSENVVKFTMRHKL